MQNYHIFIASAITLTLFNPSFTLTHTINLSTTTLPITGDGWACVPHVGVAAPPDGAADGSTPGNRRSSPCG